MYLLNKPFIQVLDKTLNCIQVASCVRLENREFFVHQVLGLILKIFCLKKDTYLIIQEPKKYSVSVYLKVIYFCKAANFSKITSSAKLMIS